MNKFELINDDYSDIINLEHHVSSKHEKMSISNRAFQFAPFAALTGYSDAIDETARTADEMLIIDDNLKCIIDQKLNYIKLNIQKNIYVKIIYFVKDLKKSGGKYFISKLVSIVTTTYIVLNINDRVIAYTDILKTAL